jgi:hypothetical protein
VNRAMGQCFMMGWEGTEVTSQIRTLIEDHHIGAFLLTTKNLKSITYFSFSIVLNCLVSTLSSDPSTSLFNLARSSDYDPLSSRDRLLPLEFIAWWTHCSLYMHL